MKKSRYTETNCYYFETVEAGKLSLKTFAVNTASLSAIYYNWKEKYGNMDALA